MTIRKIRDVIATLWSQRFPTEEIALRSHEFIRLYETCNISYCKAGSRYFVETDFDRKQLHIEIRNIFRSYGAPWFRESTVDVDTISLHIEQAFTLESQNLIDLIPLDLADDLPNVRFGSFEVCHFSEKKLAEIVNLPRLKAFGEIFDVSKLSQFTWLVFRHAEKRYDPSRSKTFLQSIDLNEVGRVRHRTRRFSAQLELGLFALALAPWEDAIANTYWTWQPFKTPWTYSISDDPFSYPNKSPDADSLTWEWRLTPDDEEYQVPLRNTIDDVEKLQLNNLQSTLHKTQIVLSLAREKKGCFNSLIEHYFLRAFAEDGLDQLLWHIATLDAAIGSGDKRSLARRIENLTNDPALTEQFNELYDRRSEYVHGREIDDSDLWQRDLTAARRISRKVVAEIIDIACSNPDWSRKKLLKHLD